MSANGMSAGRARSTRVVGATIVTRLKPALVTVATVGFPLPPNMDERFAYIGIAPGR
jgi:hypothetical protein